MLTRCLCSYSRVFGLLVNMSSWFFSFAHFKNHNSISSFFHYFCFFCFFSFFS